MNYLTTKDLQNEMNSISQSLMTNPKDKNKAYKVKRINAMNNLIKVIDYYGLTLRMNRLKSINLGEITEAVIKAIYTNNTVVENAAAMRISDLELNKMGVDIKAVFHNSSCSNTINMKQKNIVINMDTLDVIELSIKNLEEVKNSNCVKVDGNDYRLNANIYKSNYHNKSSYIAKKIENLLKVIL